MHPYVPETVFVWDGRSQLSVVGEPWWQVETKDREVIAFDILYQHTADRELAESRAKDFASRMLGPRAGFVSHISASDIDRWLAMPETRPLAPSTLGPVWISCAKCLAPIMVPVMHRDVIETFGTLCERCREAA